MQSQTPVAEYDYSNRGLPRDFDIRIEVAEQQEILRSSLPTSDSLTTSYSNTRLLAAQQR